MKKCSKVQRSEVTNPSHSSKYNTSNMSGPLAGHPVQESEEDIKDKLLSFEQMTLSDYAYTLQENMGEEPLYNAVKDGNLDRVINLMERPGVKINKKYDQGHETLLTAAVKTKNAKLIQFLLDKGADTEIKNYSGKTPLQLACFEGSIPVCTQLLKQGAKHDAIDEAGRGALHWAVKQNHPEVVTLLVGSGANINAMSDNGTTILHDAIASSERNVVESLLECGADVTFKNKDGETPLYVAAKVGREVVAERLIQKGADYNEHTKTNETVLHVSCRNGHLKVVKQILEVLKVETTFIDMKTVEGESTIRGVSRSTDGWTALHMACAQGHVDIVKLLLGHNANRKLKTKDGMTAKDVAAAFKQQRVLAVFEELDGPSETPKNDRRASLPTNAIPRRGSNPLPPQSDSKRRSSVASWRTTFTK